MKNILEINGDSIIFKPETDKHGVFIIPQCNVNLADKMAKTIGCSIKKVERNEDGTRFFFNRSITEDEYEILEEKYYKHFYGTE